MCYKKMLLDSIKQDINTSSHKNPFLKMLNFI